MSISRLFGRVPIPSHCIRLQVLGDEGRVRGERASLLPCQAQGNQQLHARSQACQMIGGRSITRSCL